MVVVITSTWTMTPIFRMEKYLSSYYLWQNWEIQTVYSDKQQIVRKKNTNKCYDNHQTFSEYAKKMRNVIAQNSAEQCFTAMTYSCQQRSRAKQFFMTSLSVC